MTTPSALVEFGSKARSLWDLDSDLVFLNHGSFGAVPRAIQARAIEVRREIERNPVEGIWRAGYVAIRDAAVEAANFVGAEPSRSGFVTNATAGINAMMQSIPLDPGDEVLHVDHGYNAVWQTILLTGRRRGIIPRRVELPLPVTGPHAVVDAFEQAISPRTRLIVVDQVTSPTAIRFPVRAILEMAKSRGVEVIVDGAHAPGMLDRPAEESMEAAAWTGNLHKWPCGLRGTALVVVREDLVGVVKPSVISHHLDQSLTAEFDWQGTFDPTPWILAGEAIRFMDRFGGWELVRQRNHDLITEAHAYLCHRFGVEPCSPLDGSMLGSMATIKLPPRFQRSPNDAAAVDDAAILPRVDPLQEVLLERSRIEVPVFEHAGRRHLRISAHVYNEMAEYERLADALDGL
jgi:isopenicillin-N epimerase